MEYAWDDYRLDRKGALLTCRGQPIDVSRKVFDCIAHLIEHRHRVVANDDLCRAIWGHGHVTQAQLGQIILAARRAVGDDGKQQRLIRTPPGLGYRWVGILDGDTRSAAPDGEAIERPTAEPQAEPQRLAADLSGQRRRRAAWLPIAALAACIAIYTLSWKASEGEAPPSSRSGDPIAALRPALRAGDFERVRRGLATLPPELANSVSARILDIRLHMAREHNDKALRKIDAMLAEPTAATDPALHAQLLVLKARTVARQGQPPTETLRLLGTALARLDAAVPPRPVAIRAEALDMRALTYMELNRLDKALRDASDAIGLYEQAGDAVGARKARANQARIWMRQGRLLNALEAMEAIAEDDRRDAHVIDEIYARNTLMRIQMELLRWDDALASSDRTMALLHRAPDSGRRRRALQLRAQALIGSGRLRLAASQLEESRALSTDRGGGLIIPALHRLESGDSAGAMAYAAQMLEKNEGRTTNDILLDGEEGALLIWIMAAQTRDGRISPALPNGVERRLHAPYGSLGRIARGRWLWSMGRLSEAESELRTAFGQARNKQQLYRMTLAAEPLVAVLLQRNKPDAARAVLDAIREIDAPRVDRDYRHGLLRLQIAVHDGDPDRIEDAHDRVSVLAGERPVTAEIQRMSAARPPTSRTTGGGAVSARSGAP